MTAPTPAAEPVLCVLCGTPVTAARSIRRRMGRDCWRKTRTPAAPTPGRGDTRAGPAQGQLALAIPVHPTLPNWPPITHVHTADRT
jgi:hypothetical protein